MQGANSIEYIVSGIELGKDKKTSYEMRDIKMVTR